MKIRLSGRLTRAELFGRIPVSSRATVIIRPKKGKGSYKRSKNKEVYNDC